MPKSSFRIFSVIIVAILGSVLAAPAFAQTSSPSDGCAVIQGIGGATPPVSASGLDFLADEELQFTVTDPDGNSTEVTLTVSSGGSVIATQTINSFPAVLVFTIPSDGTYSIEIGVTGTATDDIVTGACNAVDDEIEDETGPVTLCHRPPGNPAAAHTITVGRPAVDAHLGHGDSRGACPAGVDTKYQDFELGIVIFVIYEENQITLLNNCEGDECDSEISVPITAIINISNLTININGVTQFPQVDDPEEYEYEVPDEYGDDDGDDTEIVIYYLHPKPDDNQVGVFQLNIYQNDTLISDNVLLFIDINGDIELWTDQGYWERQLEDDD